MTALHRLAERFGLMLAHHEIDGTLREAPPETLVACLAAMGVPASTEAEAADALARVEAEDAARRLPREDALDAETPGAWFGPHDRAWRLDLEGGGRIEGDPGAPLPGLPPGVHRLTAEDGERTLLVAAPRRAPSPADLGAPRAWGVTAALYGLVAPRSFGRGDYEDLAQAAESLASLGAAFLGINPIHDLGAAEQGLSPYSPSSRTAFDARHIAWDRTPEFAASSDAQALLAEAAPRAEAAAVAEFGDAALRLDLSAPVLDALVAAHASMPEARRAAFDAWLAEGGEARRRHALFEALSLVHGPDWRFWPKAYQSTDGPEAGAFAAAHPQALRRHAFAQWLAEQQIAEAQTRARAAGMALGLYLDVAVGVRPGGAETWANPDVFARGVSLGAPPDMMNAQGQNWALAPYNPEGLRRADYAPFRAMLAAAMDRAGLVRLDHVLQLERAYWIPDGLPGAYVRPPAKILEALVRLEAFRRRVAVVGEDLGTVPEGFRERMASRRLHGCAVVQFEGGFEGYPDPAGWRRESLAAFGTHDTPTLAGWWAGEDISLRVSLGHLSEDQAARSREERAAARVALLRRLDASGLLPDGLSSDAPPPAAEPPLRDAVHALIGAAGSDLAALQLDDALGEPQPQNVPGTVEEAPNWRRRHAAAPSVLAENEALASAARALAARRG